MSHHCRQSTQYRPLHQHRPLHQPITEQAQKTKRKYTKRSSEAEAKRQEAVKLGIQKTLEAGGNFGRPKAISDESNVIDLIKSNMTNQQIADQLKISLSTVKRIKQRHKMNLAGA